MASHGGTGTRWLLCCGAGTFLEVSGKLVACGCAGGIDWEPVGAKALGRLSQSGASAVAVAVGPGCEGADARSLACSAAASPASIVTVLVSDDAASLAAEAGERGVDVTVTPRGLMRSLRDLYSSWEKGREHDGLGRRDACGATTRLCPVDEGGEVPGLGAREGWQSGPAPEGGDVREAQARGGGLRATGRLPREGVEAVAGVGRSPSISDRLPELDEELLPFDLEEPPKPAPVGVGRADQGDGEGHHGIAVPPFEGGGHTSGVVVGASSDVELVETRPCPVVDLPQAEPVPTICLASARGGVGKSALATCMALALAQDGLRVALVDLDYQFGTCLGFVGADETDGLPVPSVPGEPLVIDERVLARCRSQAGENLVAYEFCRTPEQAELLGPWSGRLVEAARSGADIAVVDLPTGVGEPQLQAFERADRCLLLGDQRALSLESLASAAALCVRAGIPRTKLVSVLNRLDYRHRDEGFVTRAGFELQTPQVMKVFDGGAEVGSMLTMGCAGELLSIRNRFALSVADLAHALCSDLGCQAPAGPGALWSPPEPSQKSRRRKQSRKELVACP